MKMYYTKNTLFPDLLIFFIIKGGCASLWLLMNEFSMHNKLVKNYQSFKTKVPDEIINADNFDHMIARSFKLLNQWMIGFCCWKRV